MAGQGKTKLPSFEDYAKQVEAEEDVIRELLASFSGEMLMRRLTAMYDGSLVAKVEGRGVDDRQTLINIGAREVVHYLRGLKDRERKTA